MNILMLGPNINAKGGVASVAKNFLQLFKRSEINISYLETYIEANFFKKLSNFIFKIIEFLYVIKKNKINLLHIHMVQGGSFYRKSIFILLAKLMNKKTIIHLHASQFDLFYNNSNFIIKKYITYILDITDKLVVLSLEWERIMKDITSTDIKIIRNAVEIKSEIKTQYNLKYITMFGRLGKRKGTYDLIYVLSELYKDEKYREFETLLCGDGDISEIKKLINELGIDNYVKIKGWIDGKQKEDICAKTYVNILPSYNEGMPMAILETMALGIPNISTNVGGITEIIEDKVNGYIIEPGDKKSLLKNIKFIIDNPNIREEFSEKSYKCISENYGIENYFDNWKDIYKSTYKKRS